MNLQELIKKHDLKEGDEVLCISTDINVIREGSKYILGQNPSQNSGRLYIRADSTFWQGDSSEFTKVDKLAWNGEGVPNFGDKLRICKKEWSFVGINSLGSWVLETEDGELKGFHSKDVKVILSKEINELTILIREELERENDEQTCERDTCLELAKTLYGEGYRKEGE